MSYLMLWCSQLWCFPLPSKAILIYYSREKPLSLSLNKIVPTTPFCKMSIFAEMQSSNLPDFCYVFLQIMYMVHYADNIARVMGWEGYPYMDFTRVLIKALCLYSHLHTCLIAEAFWLILLFRRSSQALACTKTSLIQVVN